MIPLTLGLITHPNAGHSKRIILRRFSPFTHRLGPTTLFSGAPFSHPPPTPLPSEKIGDIAHCHEDTHSFRHCRHPFIDVSGCLNPELGQRGDDDAYRRWQARMTSYRRDSPPSRAHTTKNRRNRSGQTRGFHQDQEQVNSHSGNPGNQYSSDYHGGVPPSPASSAPAVAPGMRLGAGHNPNARQPGIFRTGN